jgi:arylsulfatase A-like enzyme
LFTGLNALHHGVNHDNPVPARLTLMAELFREASYSTMAITGGGWVSPALGFEQGFEKFRTWGGIDFAGEREMATGIDHAIRWISGQGGRPFFLFFHTFEIHAPFRARQPFFANFSGSSDEAPGSLELLPFAPVAEDGFVARHRLVKAGQSGAPPDPISETDSVLVGQLYDSGIAYADDQLAHLFRALEDLDLRRRTIVVLTSDHGEALGERQLAGHTHLYDFNLMVPLVFALPDGRYAGRRIPEQVSLVDVLPTVLELAGIEPSHSFDGSSLVPLLDGKVEGRREAWSYAAVTNVGISLRVSNRLKYIYNNTAWAPLEGSEELYQLEVDPDEESNVVATASQARRLRRLVREKLESRTQGLKIHLANADGKPLSGIVKAPFLRPGRTKILDLPCECLSWDQSGRILFEVPPGKAFDVFLEGVGPGVLELEAVAEGLHAGLEWSIDPMTLDQPQSFAFDGSSWREVRLPPDRPPLTGIVVGWHGDGTVGAAAEKDEALVRQLEALGYVND